MLPARPNDNRPIPLAAPADTAFTYALRVLDWTYQAGVRGEEMGEREMRYRAAVLAEQFRNLINPG